MHPFYCHNKCWFGDILKTKNRLGSLWHLWDQWMPFDLASLSSSDLNSLRREGYATTIKVWILICNSFVKKQVCSTINNSATRWIGRKSGTPQDQRRLFDLASLSSTKWPKETGVCCDYQSLNTLWKTLKVSRETFFF